MKRFTIIIIIVVVVTAAIAEWHWMGNKNAPVVVQHAVDYKNITYTIEGQPVPLVDGHAETPATTGSADMVDTEYFGNDATGDLNGDGMDDVAFIVTQDPGGTGTFFYVVVALKTPTGYQGTTGVLLGDRIAPQTTEIKDGELIVNYMDRAASDPMSAEPSVGVTKYLKVQGTTLVEVPIVAN